MHAALAVQHSMPLFILQLSNERCPITKSTCRQLLEQTAEHPCIVAVEVTPHPSRDLFRFTLM